MPKINAGGYLTSVAEKVLAGGLDSGEKLRTKDLERICTYYGHLAKLGDLYDRLFEAENERIILDGDEVNTKDLMWFTILDHEKSRGWYWNPTGTSAVLDPSVCQGVPLALKGARRVFNKTYMSWLDVDEPIKCDIFLPQGLNSLMIDDTGKAVPTAKDGSRGGKYGLMNLYKAYTEKKVDFDPTHINRLRQEVPVTTRTYKPRMVKPTLIASDPDDRAGDIYNDLSYQVRCMLLQAWTWHDSCRHSDMISDYRDWDHFMPSLDKLSTSMEGLSPKATRIAEGYYKFTKTSERDLPDPDAYKEDRFSASAPGDLKL